MMSLIEVKCPHCGAHGQIMLPPLGAIIVGPCPECQEIVVVFSGRVLPLDKAIMEKGSAPEKQDHLLRVLTGFIEDRVVRLFGENAPELVNDEFEALPGEENAPGKITPLGMAPTAPISSEEIEAFRSIDLKLIDNPEYFKAVFH